MPLLAQIRQIPVKIHLMNLFAAYLLTCFVTAVTGGEDFFQANSVMNIPMRAWLISLLLLYAIMTALEMFFSCGGLMAFLSAVVFGGAVVCLKTEDVYLTVCVIAAVGLLTRWLMQENLLRVSVRLSDRGLVLLVGAAYLTIGGVTAYACTLRYLTYNTSTFDFGIFAQMYENMAKTGLMTVSCERNVIDSHLLRHFSPIYYLLLPLYQLFRTPVVLTVAQPMIVLSGVLPLALLCRKRGCSNLCTAALSLVFLCYPTLTAACFYDFHENLFLTPLLLWLLYFLEADSRKGIAVTTLLLLTVKEDAGIYLCCIGLYLIFYKRKVRLGLLLSAVALSVFFLTTSYIRAFGDSTLSSQHYGNLIPSGESGMAAVLRVMALNPGYLLGQLLSAEKVAFLAQMLLPLMLLPLTNRKLSQQCLLLPFLAMNLITSYSYQFNIDYQYCFGSGTLLVAMAAEQPVLRKPGKTRRWLLLMMLFASGALMVNHNLPKYTRYPTQYAERREEIAQTNELLDSIDVNKSVTADTFLVPRLYRHQELYMLNENCCDADYVLIDTRYREDSRAYERYYLEHGYTLTKEQGFVVMLERP